MSPHVFHFLRPAWFFALLPLAGLLVLLWRRQRTSRSWQAVVDPQLLPHLLIGHAQRRSPLGLFAMALGALLAVTALAGPVWSKQQQPVFRRSSALVVLLDLSQSMNTTDVKPSRLQMAKFKLRDLLLRRKEGETALIVYAADPFTVTPLTDDNDNIARQLPSLTTDLMPAQGSRADRALAQAQALLQQAGVTQGDVLLISDGIDNTPSDALHEAVRKLRGAGYRLSVLGVGSTEGAPIPVQNGGFLKDDGGAIVMARLDEQALAQLAAQGQGVYRHLSAASDNDTEALDAAFAGNHDLQGDKQVNGMKSDQWREQGPWLLLPLLPLAAFAFRRGYLLLLFVALVPPLPSHASGFEWQDLWQRPDQRAAEALTDRRPQQAASLFHDPQWRATAQYRAGDYQAALDSLKAQQGAEADYNRGNALARLGRFPEALSAYDSALQQDPQLADAKYNRDLVRQWLQQPSTSQPQTGKAQQQNGTGESSRHDRSENKSSQNKSSRGDSSAQAGGNGQPRSESDRRREDAASDKKTQTADAGNGDSGRQPQQPSPEVAGEKPQDKQAQQSAETAEDRPPSQTSPHMASALAPSDAIDKPQNPEQQATEQWLRRIPDDPGGLWRRKFLYQYKRAYQSQQGEAKPW